MKFGKTAQTGISVISLLAEDFPKGKVVRSSADIAEVRHLPQPLVAKVLTTLSTAGLVDGTRGPGGGYWLAKPPAEISLHRVVTVFEKAEKGLMCPFGPQWCGHGDPCPMHDKLVALKADWEAYLTTTTLDIFVRQGGGLAATLAKRP